VPVVGEAMRDLLLAGDSYNDRTLSRFFVIHAAITPAAMVALIVLHVAIIRMQGVTEMRFEDEEEDKPKHFNFVPDHLYTEIIMGLVIRVLLSFLATVFPAELGAKANPLVTPDVIKPEWFFYVAFRWLKLFSGTAAVLSMGLIVFLMFGWPFVDARIRKHRPGSEASVWIGILGVIAIVALTVWEAVVEH
jgi:quinol-cytochrome oxidoreductase complex cytochrome b subunit